MSTSTLSVNSVLAFLKSEKAQRLALVFNFFLVACIAYLLADLTWRLIPTPESAVSTAGDESKQIVVPTRSMTPAMREVADWHLFGKIEKQQAVVQATPVEVPETRLNLILRGVVASNDKLRARAIISEPSGNEDAYAIGEQLPGGAELNEIYPDRVILLRKGRRETLRMPEDMGLTGNARPGRALQDRAMTKAQAGEKLKEYRDALREDPVTLVQLVRPLPVRENGKFVGFRLRPGRDRATFIGFGLEAGDVVTAINGERLENPVQSMQIMRKLSSSNHLNLKIRRDGKEMDLAIQVPK